MLSRSRLVAALLAAVPLALAVPGTAHAAGTYRLDDGTMETSVRIASSDGSDGAWKRLWIPVNEVNGATGATLWAYGKADTCGATGASQRVLANGRVISDFDPCAKWSDTAFGWASFPVPMSFLRDGATNTIVFTDLGGTSTDRNVSYGIDTGTAGTSDVWQTDSAGYRDIPGEVMAYLVLTGSVPAMSVSPAALGYGIRDLGSTTTQTLTVRSTGLETLDVTGVAFGGAAAGDYAVAADTCTGAALAPGATCTVQVAFTPSAIGARNATVTVSARHISSRSATLTGEGRSAPPDSTITTADGTTLLPQDVVRGTATDDLAVAIEYVTFTPEAPGVATVTAQAALSCNAAATACDWSYAPTFLLPGRYAVTAHAVDSQGNAEAPGPGIGVLVV